MKIIAIKCSSIGLVS